MLRANASGIQDDSTICIRADRVTARCQQHGVSSTVSSPVSHSAGFNASRIAEFHRVLVDSAGVRGLESSVVMRRILWSVSLRFRHAASRACLDFGGCRNATYYSYTSQPTCRQNATPDRHAGLHDPSLTRRPCQL
jgi:hypothetical protein